MSKITALIILTHLTQLSFAYAVTHLQIPDTQNHYDVYDDENETDFSSSGDSVSSNETNITSSDLSNSIISAAHTLSYTATTLITPIIGYILSQL